MDNRKYEAERMKVINHYNLNNNLNSIQIDKLKKENNELKKEIEKYKNIINSKNFDNIQINNENNNDKEQDNDNDNDFNLFKDDEKKDSNINQINNINYIIEDNNRNNNVINVPKFGEESNRKEINLIYYVEKEGEYQNILGDIFINNNKDNI